MEKMKEYLIDRQSALDAFGEIHPLDYNTKTIKTRLENLPIIVASIIRCKDCEYWDTSWSPEWAKDEPKGNHWCSCVDFITEEDFYCAWAERKGETNDYNR